VPTIDKVKKPILKELTTEELAEYQRLEKKITENTVTPEEKHRWDLLQKIRQNTDSLMLYGRENESTINTYNTWAEKHNETVNKALGITTTSKSGD
jgi:hypothetical protein